jgi:tRNA 2-thiouridine synthesizing protein A
MATVQLDYRGLKCPVPTLKLTRVAMKNEVNPGDILEVLADCPTFEADIKGWCADYKKVLLKVRANGTHKVAQIQF